MKRKEISGLIFGVHPFGKAGMADGMTTGAPDDFEKIGQTITELNDAAKNFVVLSDVYFTGANSGEEVLAKIGQLLQFEVQRNIVLSFRCEEMELADWLKLIRDIINTCEKIIVSDLLQL